jgi:alkylation response protein AidB-like acyl-CoA dehydrogenase
MLDDPRGTTAEVWNGLAGLGVLGLLAPDGAAGRTDAVTMGVVVEECGRGLFPGPLLGSAVGAVTALAAVGADRQTAPLRRAITEGTTVATVALHEPSARYELTAPDTIAVADGDGWTVEGAKCGVPDAVAADVFVVSARAGADPVLVVVDRADLRADAVVADDSVDATRKSGSLRLDGVRGRRLGEGDLGDAVARTADVMAAMLAVDAVGAAARALELAVDYAKERVQFGSPIGSFQAVQHLCADMLGEIEIVRAGAYYALWACDAAPAFERHRAATMAKAYASEALPRVGEQAIQVLGGIGFTWEHDMHLLYKRTLSAAAMYGNGAHHYDELARLVMDRSASEE